MTVLDLGCGNNKRDPNATGVDIRDYPDVDVVADIEDELPFADNHARRVLVYSILEHVDDLPGVMRTIHRITEPGGIVEGKVPYYADKTAHTDPTHTQTFTCDTFDYWDSTTKLGQLEYFEPEFRVLDCNRIKRVQFWKSRPIYFNLEVVK